MDQCGAGPALPVAAGPEQPPLLALLHMEQITSSQIFGDEVPKNPDVYFS